MSKFRIQRQQPTVEEPKSFLELISLYSKILISKDEEVVHKIKRLENGLDKLYETGKQVDALKEQLAIQEVELAKKNAEVSDRLLNLRLIFISGR